MEGRGEGWKEGDGGRGRREGGVEGWREGVKDGGWREGVKDGGRARKDASREGGREGEDGGRERRIEGGGKIGGRIEGRNRGGWIVFLSTVFPIHWLFIFFQKAGIKVKDWVLSINGTDVRYKSHDDVVAIVKECKEEVTLEVTTPATPTPQHSPSRKLEDNIV